MDDRLVADVRKDQIAAWPTSTMHASMAVKKNRKIGRRRNIGWIANAIQPLLAKRVVIRSRSRYRLGGGEA